jgi:hypothetical protein
VKTVSPRFSPAVPAPTIRAGNAEALFTHPDDLRSGDRRQTADPIEQQVITGVRAFHARGSKHSANPGDG